MSSIKWIKIATDIFDNEKIKLIEKMPEGDTILIIWLKLLTLAGKKNDSGLVYITRDIPYTPDTLADVMGKDHRIVSLALNTFISFNMIEIENDIVAVLGWSEHQSSDKLQKIQNQNKERQKQFRDRQKIQIKSNVTNNVTSRVSNDTEGRGKKEDKDIKKEDKEHDIDFYIQYWNEKDLKRYRHLSTNLRFTSDILRNLSVYTKDEVMKSIENYAMITKDDKYEPFPEYPSGFEGFMSGNGIDIYHDAHEHLDKFKKKIKETSDEQAKRELREMGIITDSEDTT